MAAAFSEDRHSVATCLEAWKLGVPYQLIGVRGDCLLAVIYIQSENEIAMKEVGSLNPK